MDYDEAWKPIEETYDLVNNTSLNHNLVSSLLGVNVEDAMSIRKQIDYAKDIGDPASFLLSGDAVQYPEIFNQGRRRAQKHPFEIQPPNIFYQINPRQLYALALENYHKLLPSKQES